MFLENRKIVSPLSVRLAGLYDLNFNDVQLALCHIISKYNCQSVNQAGQIFVELYNKSKGK